jgi:hypothetical protein
MPKLIGVDKPAPEDLPEFVQNLVSALDSARKTHDDCVCDLSLLTWRNVFQQIKSVWHHHMAEHP